MPFFRSDTPRAATPGNRAGRRVLAARLLFLALASLTLLLAGCKTDATAAGTPDAFAQNRRLGRGVNIIGYDPIWRAREQGRFQAGHFRLLREAGFQHVRINLHPFRHMDKTAPFALRPAWLETLDWAVDNALANGLLVVLDMHEFNAMAADPAALKPQWLAFWRQLAEHCQHRPSTVLFELLNEPNKKLGPEQWNQYLAEALAVVRATNPARTVVIGPAFWNSMDHLDELALPPNDRNLIVTVHYYKPFSFTHQGAPWSSEKDKSGITWGAEADRAVVRADFAKVAVWAKSQGRPIYLGEFGAYDKAPLDARVRYTDFVARSAEEMGWSWAYWQFDSDFILYDIARDGWNEPIRRALIPGR